MREMDINGCMEMYGTHIFSCIDDICRYHHKIGNMLAEWDRLYVLEYGKKSRHLHQRTAKLTHEIDAYNTAKAFLFTNRIDITLSALNLKISADAIRNYTRELIKNNERPVKGIRFATSQRVRERNFMDASQDDARRSKLKEIYGWEDWQVDDYLDSEIDKKKYKKFTASVLTRTSQYGSIDNIKEVTDGKRELATSKNDERNGKETQEPCEAVGV